MSYLKAITKGALLVAATVGLSSCLKNKGNDYVQPDLAGLSIYHASPGTQAFDFGLDGYKISNGYSYRDRTGYYDIYTGTRNIAFLKAGATSLADSIRTVKFAAKKDSAYSAFLIGPSTAPETFVINDKLEAPASGKANIRFINLSPDAGALTLKATANTADTTLSENINYKKATAFSSVYPKTYTFRVYKDNALEASSTNISIVAGRNYTVWVVGLANTQSGGNQAITVNVDENDRIIQKKE